MYDKASSEMCHFYDISRVNAEERFNEVQKQEFYHLSVISAEDNPQNDYPNEISDEEKYSNAEDNAQNDYTHEISNELKIIQEICIQMKFLIRKRLRKSKWQVKLLMNQKAKVKVAIVFLLMSFLHFRVFSLKDKPGNDYPYKMFDEEVDLNAEANLGNDYPYEISHEEASLDAECTSWNVYQNVISDEEELEQEVQVESKAAVESENDASRDAEQFLKQESGHYIFLNAEVSPQMGYLDETDVS